MGFRKVRTNIASSKLGTISDFLTSYGDLSLDKVNTIVLHWTSATDINTSIKKARAAKVNYHFFIDTNGEIIQTAPLSRKIPHAGWSYGPNGAYCNGYSYAIGIVKKGAYSEETLNSIKDLIINIRIINPNVKYVTGHNLVSPGRRSDPQDFDFKTLASSVEGLSVWSPFIEGDEYPKIKKGLKKGKDGNYYVSLDKKENYPLLLSKVITSTKQKERLDELGFVDDNDETDE